MAAAPPQPPAAAPATAPSFLLAEHTRFILALDKDKDTFEYCATEHLRMQGVYWALCAMDTLTLKSQMQLADIAEWVQSCYHPDCGGYGGNTGHDAHLLYTQHAVYVLALCGALDRVDRAAVTAFVTKLQQPDGSFAGDVWGEVDTRFTYCAVATLSVLGTLHAADSALDLPAAMRYVVTCQNFDGGFGCVPGAESHAGYVFVCVAALSIGGSLGLVATEQWNVLAWWLGERQCDSGGLNGRPEKQADVCYSWWVLSSLSVLQRMEWIDRPKLVDFILECQDPECGGIADRPDNVGDVYHTFFGICGLSLLGYLREEGGGDEDGAVLAKEPHRLHRAIDPVYALPRELAAELGLVSQLLDPVHVVAAVPSTSSS